MTTSNTYNQGIFHLVFQYGQRPLCGQRRAIMAQTIKKAMEQPNLDVCKKCAAKLIEMERRTEDKQNAA